MGSAFLQKVAAWQTSEGRDFSLPSMREARFPKRLSEHEVEIATDGTRVILR